VARRFHRIHPAAALLLALPAGSASAAPPDYGLCRAGSMLDFFVPGLPTDVPRETAPTDFDAAAVTVVKESSYVLEGDVVATRADQRLAAEKVTYDQPTSHLVAEGDVRYQDKDLLLAAERADARMDTDVTQLDDVRYQLVEARGNGIAERATRTGEQRTELAGVTYSTCDPDRRDWEIVAREIELDHENGVGTARGMRVRFKDTTILALPYATFPIDDRRRSGFLYPQLGGSNDDGFDLSVPYYLNLAPNYDATLVPRLITERGLMLGGEFRYLFGNQRGEIAGNWLPGDDAAGGRDRWAYRFDHVAQFSPNFNFVADINRVSDDRYFEDFGDSLAAAATSLLPSSAYVNGRGTWWSLAFGGDDIEVTDPTVAPQSEPYQRLPRFALDAEYPVRPWFAAGLRTELVRFDKDDALTGDRYDVQPFVAFPVERAGWFVRPELAWRATRYELDRDGDDTLTRDLPIASVDAGLFFERPTTLFGTKLRQTLEPRVYYLNVPYEDQDDLPIFDTQELTFSFAQLFRPNRYSGADRQIDANNLTLALTTRLLDDASGEEVLRASLGEILYFDDQRVQLPGVPARDDSRSAWAGELDFRLDERWRVALSQQYDPERERTDLSAIRLQRTLGERGVLNLAYRFRRDFLEQVDASTAFPLNDSVRLVGRVNYSLRDDKTLEAFAGVEWDNCCYAFRILGRHHVRNVEGESANALFLELELKGIGAIGRRTGNFLQRAILGYR
jgi:LPS-assembly protein